MFFMDRQQVRWALFKISFVAVASMTWISTSFVFATRPEEELETENSNPLVTLVRLPASLPAVPGQLPKLLTGEVKAFAPIRMDVLKLSCWDNAGTAEQAVAARWVRLIGRPCHSDAESSAIEVRNLTTGYSGTVFAAQHNMLTTDFIPLETGPNEILIRIGEGEGVAFENRLVLNKAAE
jgi:hypothetical protein